MAFVFLNRCDMVDIVCVSNVLLVFRYLDLYVLARNVFSGISTCMRRLRSGRSTSWTTLTSQTLTFRLRWDFQSEIPIWVETFADPTTRPTLPDSSPTRRGEGMGAGCLHGPTSWAGDFWRLPAPLFSCAPCVFSTLAYKIALLSIVSTIPKALPLDERMSYEASLVSVGGARSQPCIVTGYPVLGSK